MQLEVFKICVRQIKTVKEYCWVYVAEKRKVFATFQNYTRNIFNSAEANLGGLKRLNQPAAKGFWLFSCIYTFVLTRKITF